MRGAPLALTLLFATPALADGPEILMTGADCRASWAVIAGLAGESGGGKLGDGPFPASDGACEMRDVSLDAASARRLRWRVAGSMTAEQLPLAAEVDLYDLRLGALAAKAGGGGWFKMAAARLDGGFAFHREAGSQKAEIDQIYLTTGAGNRLALRARLEGLDAGALPAGLMTARITALDFSLETTDLSALLAALPATGAAPTAHKAQTPPDPAKSVQTALTEALADLPPALLAPEDRAALQSFAAALPHAAGRLDLHVEAPGGLTPASFALLGVTRDATPQDVFRLLAGSTITIRWTPGG